ncbi:MAG: dihydroorotate dehydrogenase [Candidatus Methanomethylicota archaeon]|uniref:Dihydroorotate dehydrogenase n=2 Tax=Thermoproteota archaeon TaxID=2056631 RepID=A0A497ESJ6_9CREN|nr:MAG: dihydroorotate dehydrogenase [Candidatus Verstraetearchaeota archaeon]
MENPTMLASGILGSSGSMIRRVVEEGGAGAAVTKSLTIAPREGYSTPCLIAVKEGFINAMGLPNPGYKNFLDHELPEALKCGAPIIVSIAGSSSSEFREIAAYAEKRGAHAVELNLSCPHVAKMGLDIGADPEAVYDVVKEVKSFLKIPVYVKLGLSDKIVEAACKAEKAGADAIVAINTVKAMAIDIYSKKPILSAKYGGLSGPAVHHIAVRCIYDIYEAVSVPLIGVGGVEDWKTAVELILAGASAVQIGSAIAVKGLKIFKEVCLGLKEYLKLNGFSSVKDIVGLSHKL